MVIIRVANSPEIAPIYIKYRYKYIEIINSEYNLID
tara:strand:- start:517 stop:624 length:108 start_codon:yes stop_codon:yes gene_type:complete